MAGKMFRKMDTGNGVEIAVNSHAATDNFYVDRSRLRTKECVDYVPNDNPMKPGKYVKRVETASIMDNARQAAGAMRMASSFSSSDGKDVAFGDDCCAPTGYYGSRNPLNRRRGDE